MSQTRGMVDILEHVCHAHVLFKDCIPGMHSQNRQELQDSSRFLFPTQLEMSHKHLDATPGDSQEELTLLQFKRSILLPQERKPQTTTKQEACPATNI